MGATKKLVQHAGGQHVGKPYGGPIQSHIDAHMTGI
jgi:hypothetical protein